MADELEELRKFVLDVAKMSCEVIVNHQTDCRAIWCRVCAGMQPDCGECVPCRARKLTDGWQKTKTGETR